MHAIAQSTATLANTYPRQIHIPGTAELCRDCVVVESSAEEPWADFCRGLVRPAMLLPMADANASE